MIARLVVNGRPVGTGVRFNHTEAHVALSAARALGYTCSKCEAREASVKNQYSLYIGSVRLVTVEVT